MSFPAAHSVRVHPFDDLLRQFTTLCHEVRRASECADVRLCGATHERRQSLENLHAYLALRSHDLRPLQQSLSHLGLASMEHTEPHVLATLDALLSHLRMLAGLQPDPGILPPQAAAFEQGPELLRQNTDRLFGPAPERRPTRIMITLPDSAADDPMLLQSLLKGGMDCARINCAYGDQEAWSQVLNRLRKAEQDTGYRCRVFMDLRGPKLRTGRMVPEPAVLKVRPQRARDGKVLRPARLWLTASKLPQPEQAVADASLVLEGDWLQQSRAGDRIGLRDARGSHRNWRIIEVTAAGCWAESRKTTYLENGTILHLYRGKTHNGPQTMLNSLAPVEARVSVRPGDELYLVRGTAPGQPSVHDLEGRLLRSAKIPLDVPEVFRDARAGEVIRFDDGRISGVIEQVGEERLKVRIQNTRRPEEMLSSHKGVNLPETDLDLPALGDEDLRDLEFVARNADIIGLSFTNRSADVRFLHQQLQALGRADVGVIFKLETRRGCANLADILMQAMALPNFGVMIARGDLAAECGFESLAELQEDILRVCESAHAPVALATGVLEGLARRGHPVRAEITDAALAQQAECVMLGKGAQVTRALQTLDHLLTLRQARACKQQALLDQLRLGQ